MGLLFPDKRITERELHKALSELDRRGLTSRERDKVGLYFSGHLDNDPHSGPGIKAEELEQAIKKLKADPGKLDLDHAKVDMVHETLKRYL